MSDRLSLAVCQALLLLTVLLVRGDPCEAAGRNLTGRQAPDLTFAAGINGVNPGQRLSQLRGEVVWLKFWVHNCPICLSQMPAAQDRFARWRDFGLRIVTIVHKIDASHAQRLMTAKGWKVPVVLDRKGRLARRYGVKRRPTHYLVGHDGRVALSNRISDSAIGRALGARRLAAVEPVPERGRTAADAVRSGETGRALRLAQTAGDAAFLSRVRQVAEEDLRAHARRARRWIDAGRRERARTDLETLRTEYLGTPLADLAQAQRASVLGK